MNIHKKLAALWYQIGGRNPCGSKLTKHFIRKHKLLDELKEPEKKHDSSTPYYKRMLRQFNGNSAKLHVIKTFMNRS